MEEITARVRVFLKPRPRASPAVRVGITVVSWVAALALTMALEPYVQRSLFVFFWVAILAAAWWAGRAAALLSATLAVAAVSYLFLEPRGQFLVLNAATSLQLAIFWLVTLTVTLLIGRLEDAQRRTDDDARHLAEANELLQEQAMELEQQKEEAQALAEELEQTNMELELQAMDANDAREVAEHANRAKADFLATMSHELRTPINAAMGYVDLLEAQLHGPLTPAQRDDLARIRRSQRRLLTLVNDVLSFARIESASLELHPVDVTLAALLPLLEESIGPLAAARGVRYTCELPDESLVVRADAERLEQILVNLLSNAVKFTDPGGSITLRAEAADDAARIDVHDTGRGVPADKQEAIFEPFVQVEQGLTRTVEGTGLGLAISQRLARAMGGDITVRSAPGAGSTFTVTMPRARARQGAHSGIVRNDGARTTAE